MKRLAWTVGLAGALASGAYVFIYQYRWEWNRATFMAMVFLAFEVGLFGAYLAGKVNRLVEANRRRPGEPDDAVVQRLRQVRAERDHFAWLEPVVNRTNIFLTVLVSGGLVVSVGSWLVDRVAGSRVGSAMDERLAGRLRSIGFPDAGLVPSVDEVAGQATPIQDRADLRILLGPSSAPSRSGPAPAAPQPPGGPGRPPRRARGRV